MDNDGNFHTQSISNMQNAVYKGEMSVVDYYERQVCTLFWLPIIIILCLRIHGSYEWIIMLEKCGRLDLTVFQLIWVIGTYDTWKNQNPGGHFGATS